MYAHVLCVMATCMHQIQSISKKVIGHGAWGVVYSGTFQQEPVAIKYAHKDLLHTTTIDMLKREVMIMANIQHPNLVRFVGAVFDNAVERGRDMPIILSELMDMNLRTAYKKKNLSSSPHLHIPRCGLCPPLLAPAQAAHHPSRC